jgi:hypothetical protein
VRAYQKESAEKRVAEGKQLLLPKGKIKAPAPEPLFF